MTTYTTAKLRAYAFLGALGLLAAIALGRVEPVVLAAPFLLVLASGLPFAGVPQLGLRLVIDRERALQGDEVEARIDLATERAVERVELLLRLPSGLEAAPKPGNPLALRLASGESRTIELPVRCLRWGAYLPGEIAVRGHDLLGLVVHEVVVDHTRPLRVYPRPEQLGALVRAHETQAAVGEQVSRAKGEGIEFADLRPFVPGDRIRRVNWRASARRGELWVNEANPERNTDVVLFLDTFEEARLGERGTLDLTVRAAAALAEQYLRHRDRVGLVSFGGTLSWLVPASGEVQRYRIVDAMLESEIALSHAWKGIDIIPRHTLPPKALVLALSPLLDERSVGALLDLRARGFDLAIVHVSPAPFVTVGEGEHDALAFRVWQLQLDAVRARLLSLGVPVATWREGEPLALPLSEVTAFRRAAGPARA